MSTLKAIMRTAALLLALFILSMALLVAKAWLAIKGWLQGTGE
jgi:hypothetical protein